MPAILKQNQTLPEMTETLTAGLEMIRDNHGVDGAIQTLETMMLQLTVSEWARKAPGSTSRLKRVYRAMASPAELNSRQENI